MDNDIVEDDAKTLRIAQLESEVAALKATNPGIIGLPPTALVNPNSFLGGDTSPADAIRIALARNDLKGEAAIAYLANDLRTYRRQLDALGAGDKRSASVRDYIDATQKEIRSIREQMNGG